MSALVSHGCQKSALSTSLCIAGEFEEEHVQVVMASSCCLHTAFLFCAYVHAAESSGFEGTYFAL